MPIKIIDKNGDIKASGNGQLLYNEPYDEGDSIVIEGEGFAVIAPDDAIPPALGFFKGRYTMPVPFREGKRRYSPKAFSGNAHFLWARQALKHEITAYRNLALNPADNPINDGFFPHATANIETRGESVFFAGNAIDGINAAHGHGDFPFGSWGINRREHALLRVEFGTNANVDKIVIALRSDFPHDNWWKSLTVEFADGGTITPELKKTGELQVFEVSPRITDRIILKDMKKDGDDPSPFPALNQLEVWGNYCL